MFYKFSQISGRVAPTEALSAYVPQGFSRVPVLPSRPSPHLQQAQSSPDALFNRPNRVPVFQRLFQGGSHSVPVFLKGGKADILIYRSAMVLSLVGIGVCLEQLYMASTGRQQKV
ncbi:cytochrome c oxidase subunit 7A2, mitochondrial-like [Oscarella lobularis]|uniref:cytochrome c oxidase subunit 7A2, mitochondrial-like n=1 Tax=Oscarella lobularis TaxID=121494 RepID=UPI003313A7BC